MNLIAEYRWRGLLHDLTDGAEAAFTRASRTAYIGFDPTADSLHVGNLLAIMGLVHLQRAGHSPIAVAGGGTGLVGDPSGKAHERQLLSREQVEANLVGIRAQLEHFLDFEAKSNPARVVNNLDWLGEMGVLDFLRDVGKHFSVNSLMRKEAVRRRLEEDEAGISFTEFSYVLLQAYDFLALHDRYGCTVQMGGSDQWGNITAGIDLIRRVRGEKAYGVVYPLITTATGAKFGKTEEGAVWLDAARTSPYRFYQFWLNVDDRDALQYLRAFTLLGQDEIEGLAAEFQARPDGRAAQRALAEDVTRRLHGDEGLSRAKQATEVLFGGSLAGLGAEEIEDIFADVPSTDFARDELGADTGIVDLLTSAGVSTSRGDARRAIAGGGIYLNSERVADDSRVVTAEDALEGRFLVVRKGKRHYHLIRLIS